MSYEKNVKMENYLLNKVYKFSVGHFLTTLRKKCYWINSISDKSIYIMDTNQYAIELVTYLLALVAYVYELIVNMLLTEMQ